MSVHTLKTIPVTIAFIVICAVIVLLHYIIFQQTDYSHESVILFGALDQQLISKGQIWRLLTYAFGHMSMIHFFINLPILFILSRSLERFFGSFKFFLFLILTSISGGILFYFFYEGPMPISGSSGPVFGFIGILTFLTVRYFDRISANDKRFTVIMLLIGFVSTFLIPSVAISVHLGGFFGGILVAFIDSLFKEEKVQTTE